MQSKAFCCAEYSATFGHTSVVRDMLVSQKSVRFSRTQIKVAPRICLYSSLAETWISVEDFIFICMLGGKNGASDKTMAWLIKNDFGWVINSV